MTLHWWMHWFWVTVLLIAACHGKATPAPQPEETQRNTTESEAGNNPERQARAMYFPKTPLPTASPTNATQGPTISSNQTTQPIQLATAAQASRQESANATETTTEVTINSTLKTPNVTSNATELANSTSPTKRRNNLTRDPDVIKDLESHAEGASESLIVTEKPLSLETTLLQTRVPNVESSRRMEPSRGGMDTGAIAGISFGALALAALAGSTAFVLYRRRYLNKPQTLNDKCSNPDSSGYLDDSTVRDNSEEMYSLDNDSFLNSLEAMTIQNYWTDTVKHTKL